MKQESKANLDASQKFILDLYKSHGAYIQYLIRNAGIAPQDTEDVFQDVMVRLIRNASALRELEQNRLNSYIALCVRSTVIDRSRVAMSGEIPTENEMLDSLSPMPPSPIPGETTWNVELLKANLSGREWNLLVGKYIFDYEPERLARDFGCKPNSLRMALCRIRKKARTLLRQEGGEKA